MPLQSYSVAYSTDGVTFTNLSNVQSVNITLGKRTQLEQIRASTATVLLRYPSGYASPITQLVSGTYLQISNSTGTPYKIWVGRINDVRAEYGIPYVNNVGNADYLEISCEGLFATLGRMQGNGYVIPQTSVIGQFANALIQHGVNFFFAEGNSNPVLASTTVNGTWADWYAGVAQTINGRLWDGERPNVGYVLSPFFVENSFINFSDVANNSTNQVYSQISFTSLADNYYTQVTVDPENFAAATVTKVGATAPYRTYLSNSFNSSTAQATDFANYLLANYGEARFAIASVTCSGEAQNSFQLDKIGIDDFMATAPGTRVSVTFRGTVFQCVIEGVNMSATPAGSSFTFYLSGADLNAYMILNDAVFGRLDFNKLGY